MFIRIGGRIFRENGDTDRAVKEEKVNAFWR